MVFPDPLRPCLLVLLFVLLCGDRYVRLFAIGLWRVVRLDEYRRGGCHLAGFLAAMLALACTAAPGAAAVLAVMALVLLGGGAVFRPFWGVPALLGYEVLPAGAGGLGLMVTCLRAAGRAGEDATVRFVALLLLLGLGHGMATACPLLWVAGLVGMAGISLLAEGREPMGVLLRHCRLFRPLLLLAVMEMSRQQGMAIGAESAFFALLLDLVCQCLAVLWPHGALLALPVPPLPGFAIGWAGLHSALGLSVSNEGLTIVGCLLAVTIMLLSLGDGLLILGTASPLQGPGRGGRAWMVLLAAGLPSACGSLAGWLCGRGAGWTVWLYCLSGGDGSMVALPFFCLVLLGLWACFVRGGRQEEIPAMQAGATRSADGRDEGGLEVLRALMQAPLLRSRTLGRFVMRGKKQWRGFGLSAMEMLSLLPLRDPGAVFWLVFLGGVLVVLGLAQ